MPGTKTFAFDAGEVNGSYIEQMPADAVTGKPLPVIFDLHGYEEPGPVQAAMSTLGSYGQTHGFVTITPWIDNQPVPRWLATVGSEDMTWFGDLLTHVETTTCVDEHRVFVTGISNGAAMASAVACQFSSRVAAVATVSGIQADAPCKATRPVPVVAFHGTADPVLHYDGTPSKGAAALLGLSGSGTLTAQQAKLLGLQGALTQGPTIPERAAAWAKRNGCSNIEQTTRIAKDVTLLTWSCPNNADVELFRVTRGGHTWPGSLLAVSTAKIAGRTTFSIAADAEMWKFFQTHPLTPSG
jgi:polyhydroxybutyrate depolymerase